MHSSFTLGALVAIAAISNASPTSLQKRQGDYIAGCQGSYETPRKHLCFDAEYERIITEDGMSLWYRCIDEKHTCDDASFPNCWPLHNNMVPYRSRKCYTTTYEAIPVGMEIQGYGAKANPKCPFDKSMVCNGDYRTPPTPGKIDNPPPRPSFTPEEIAAMPEPDRPRKPGGELGETWKIVNPGGFREHCVLDLSTFKDGKGTQHCKVFWNDDEASIKEEFDQPYTEQVGDDIGTIG